MSRAHELPLRPTSPLTRRHSVTPVVSRPPLAAFRILQVVGGILGKTFKANGDFVGTPQAQWFRQQARTGTAVFKPITGATDLEYEPNADDVGACLRLECVGPYGGAATAVETSPLALDPQMHAELQENLRRGHAEFHAHNQMQVTQLVRKTARAHAGRARKRETEREREGGRERGRDGGRERRRDAPRRECRKSCSARLPQRKCSAASPLLVFSPPLPNRSSCPTCNLSQRVHTLL
eukprot:4123199-Pleurochrysis_carterae.AAC.1